MKRFFPAAFMAVFTLVILQSCLAGEKPGSDGTLTPSQPVENTEGEAGIQFNADSAYAFVAKQVEFGPRVPGTDEHRACGDWLEQKLNVYCDDVIIQNAQLDNWDGRKLPLRNIVGVLNPAAEKRIMLSAHWDTRPIADQDSSRTDEPIDGANDGGSGVGVLLEVARVLSQEKPGFGVDIVLFDLEDGGNSSFPDSYCLGSQYWAKNPHVEDYRADFGILLDMVGAEGAVFYREGISMYFASDVVNKVWDAAARVGARSWFMFNEEPFPQLTDDHLYINRFAQIPTIDIIQYDRDTPQGFGDFWHTHADNMSIIDKSSLNAVGKTLLEVLANE